MTEGVPLFITSLDGCVSTVWINNQTSVLEIKEQISETRGLSIEQQRLIFAGHLLENERLVMSYDICGSTTIHLIIQ